MYFPYGLGQECSDYALEFVNVPFRYFVCRHALARSVQENLLCWFETSAPWRLVETDFYEQYEFSMLDVAIPDSVLPIVCMQNLSTLRDLVSKFFDNSFDEQVTLLAHKLVAGQRIAIHNDHLSGHETHRLTIQLNRGLKDDDGGFFLLFNDYDPSAIHRVIRPLGGSCLGFEISEKSYHAVSRLHRGERYTLVFSFHARIPHGTHTSVS